MQTASSFEPAAAHLNEAPPGHVAHKHAATAVFLGGEATHLCRHIPVRLSLAARPGRIRSNAAWRRLDSTRCDHQSKRGQNALRHLSAPSLQKHPIERTRGANHATRRVPRAAQLTCECGYDIPPVAKPAHRKMLQARNHVNCVLARWHEFPRYP